MGNIRRDRIGIGSTSLTSHLACRNAGGGAIQFVQLQLFRKEAEAEEQPNAADQVF
jgi:hypothetical protein